jgi:hypothetical protein
VLDGLLPTIQAIIKTLGVLFQFTYSIDNSNRLVNLLFFDHTSLQLLRQHPFTFSLGCTYKNDGFNIVRFDHPEQAKIVGGAR